MIGRLGAGVVLLTALTACSSSSSDPDARDKESDATAVCAKDATKVSVPAGFPADFPLPPGTIVTNVDDRGSDGGIVVTGVTSTAFKTVLTSLQTGLPAAGFTPKDGEVEPHDAESDWTSSKYQGRWAIRELSQCSNDVSVNVVARKK